MHKSELGEAPKLSDFFRCWPWTTVLLVSYLAVFLAKQVLENRFHNHGFISNYFALSTGGLAHGYVWQLLTYQFLHANWPHLILNGWVILVFGSVLEQWLGGRRFILLMFSSGIIGGAFQILTALLWPGLFGGGVVGASACACGLVGAYAMLFPEQELTLLIFFLFRVRMRALTLLMVFVVIAGMGIIFPIDNLANAAHLGGLATGWFYVKKMLKKESLPKFAKADSGSTPATTEAKAKDPRSARGTA